MKITKAHIHALEKVFGREIDGRYLQSKANIYKVLKEKNLVDIDSIKIDGNFPVTVRNVVRLTHLGRMIYCSYCGEMPGSEIEETGGGKREKQ